MAEKEYIERGALVEKMFPIGMPNNGKYPINAKAVRTAIEQVPAADVVEVVRCKDCNHFSREMIGDSLECVCKLSVGMVHVSPDSYCSYGERKEQK